MVKTLWRRAKNDLRYPGAGRRAVLDTADRNVCPTERKWSCRVVLVIPNWNGRRYLEPCLRSVFAQEFRDFAVVVVDNGSADGSADLVRTRFPQVHLIENSENRGFAAANNQAIRASASEYVVTLNNDTEVDPEWLGALVRAANADPCIGMCASKMLLADRREAIDSAGIVVNRAGMIWNRESGNVDHPGAAGPIPVFGPCAGAALYRRAMLDDVGLFDEDFFAYMEDVDLAWRAQWAGWRCVYVPQAIVYHVHSATGKEGSHFKNRMLGRNKMWLLCKNYPLLSWYAPLVLAYDLMSVGYAMAAGRGFGALQGRIESLGKIPRMLAKRRQIERRVSPGAMMAMLHPVENPLAVLGRYTRPGVGRGAPVNGWHDRPTVI
jgi:GT2 family glycosyltransferase